MVPILPLVPMDHPFDESYPFVYIGHVCGIHYNISADLTGEGPFYKQGNKLPPSLFKVNQMLLCGVSLFVDLIGWLGVIKLFFRSPL